MWLMAGNESTSPVKIGKLCTVKQSEESPSSKDTIKPNYNSHGKCNLVMKARIRMRKEFKKALYSFFGSAKVELSTLRP